MPQLEFIIFLVDFATVVVPVLAGNMPAVSGWPCEGHKSTCISIVSRNSIAKYQQYASESNLIQNVLHYMDKDILLESNALLTSYCFCSRIVNCGWSQQLASQPARVAEQGRTM